ncbi:DUF4157 domain-containing protein [Streptomyces sparsogenes]|uniref:eCIS core domain-containing protein n=1 Tax=Streptomyces sparsogenes TaxID=67365 RepID=UPI0033D45C0D
MSTSQATSQDDRSTQSAKRRKRKERAASSRAPEPKDIVSGAGQPLDPSVRRELEERLGHDFSRVRLHTDRDAGQLTELLGADAVAVGQDIFFREHAYHPGTAEGQRLLAHELLHTVQNPHGLGTLLAGRDVGAVSLPQDAIEREAEGSAAAPERAVEVEEAQATPGWLRYTTVDADRHRMEQIDPATLVDRLANSVVRSLRGDPEDRSKRTRMQLARLSDELQDAVLNRLETRLLSSEHERVLDLVDEIEADGDVERESLDAPTAEPDPVEALLFERETRRRTAEDEREEERQPEPAPGPEKDQPAEEGAPGSTPRNDGASERDGQGAGRQAGPGRKPGADARREGGGASSGARAPSAQASASAPASQSQPQQQSSSPSGGEKKAEAGGKSKEEENQREQQAQQGVPTPSKEESAAKNRPGAVESLVAGRQVKQEDKRGTGKPTGSPTVSGKDTPLRGAVSTLDGVRNQDLDGPEEEAEEDPFGSGSGSEVEVGGGEQSAWDIKLQPEDFLPTQDLDVSGVPTADKLDTSSSGTPAAPSFPAPPVTKADKVQAERDAEDAEDAEDEAAEAAAEEDDAGATADTEPSADADGGDPGGGRRPGGLAVDLTAEAPPTPSAVSRDPKSGADPKAGPVAAQVTVQQAAGTSEGGTEAGEQAAREEKGTPAAGDKSGGAPERASQQAVGGQAAAQEPAAKEEQKKTDAAPAGRSEPAADSPSPSPARDTQVTGGSNADTPGGASSGARSEPGPPAERTEAPAPARAPAAAPVTESAPPAPAPRKAAEPAAPAQAPATKGAKPRSAPAAKGPSGGGGGGRAGGGGGGGKASAPAKGKKTDSGPAPNLSQVSPEAGLSTAAKLKPHVALQAMTGVSGSVDRTVGDEHKALAAAPPSMQRPAGAPQTLEGKPRTDAPAQYSQDPAPKSEAPEQEEAKVTGAKEPEGRIEAEKAEEPGGWDTFKMALGFGVGKFLSWVGFEVDAQELAAKFAGLPTKDEALKQAQAGNAPGVQMQGAADQTAGEQGSAVDTKGQETVTTGRDDAARGMGEDQIYPNAPRERMQAKVPGQQGGGAGGAPGGDAATGAVPPEAASEVAEHERGPQFQAAFTEGQKGMSEGRQAKDRGFRDGQQKHKQQVDAEIKTNTQSQAGEREKAMTEVTAKREDWRTEQDKELRSLGDKKTERHDKIRKDVKDKEEQTDKDVEKEKDDSDKKIQDKGDQAERDAEKKRDDSVQESGNWISKAFDWIKDKVIEIKNAIVRVIKEARDAVIGFIKNFKETVERWINDARKAIVDAIKSFIDDLIEFAKAMVRAVVDLAKRIRNFITGLIDAAIALVNKLASMLKQIITDLLDALGKLLSGILDILKKALRAAIDAVVSAVKAVLDFASKLLGALGEFMLIAVDFLSDPGGWLSGAKNSAVDGAKNHLFREVKAAVKDWFQSKIQEILGVPKAVIDKLLKGGFSMERIVKETWDAIVPQLPFIIGEIVITKVIAKLIPGAGWVMAVIDAIRTAIGALGEILRAMGAVLDWLKAVRSGGAGILFAKAVAAGIVALLELAYEALLSGIGKWISKVGKRFRSIAENLGKDKGGGRGPGGAGAGPNSRGGKPGESQDRGTPTGAPSTRPTTPSTRPTAPPTPTTRPSAPATRPAKPTTRPTTSSSTPSSRPNAPATSPSAPSRPTTTKPTTTRPTTSTAPKKPTTPGPGRDAGPGAPTKAPADGKKPATSGKSDQPTTKDNKPDTRPTPTAKPDPKPEPQPKADPGTPPRQPKDDPQSPPKEGSNSDSRNPKEEDRSPAAPDKTATSPNNSHPNRPKETDPNRPKGDKDGQGKPTSPKNGDSRKPRPNKGDDKTTPKKTKPTDRKRTPDDEKDRRDKEEKTQEPKHKRLNNAVVRIRKILENLLRPGVPKMVHRATLYALRRWYRLKSLEKQSISNDKFEVKAELNPWDTVTSGYSDNLKDYLNNWELPNPEVTPTPKDRVRPARETNAIYINPRYAFDHGKEPSGQFTYGWTYLDTLYKGVDPRPQWDRMHLIPREVGGAAETSNFVPARNSDNSNFYYSFEIGAARAFGLQNYRIPAVPGWYRINLTRYGGPTTLPYKGTSGRYPEGFPKTIEAEWGLYKKKGSGTGRARSDWERLSAKKRATKQFNPPPTSSDPAKDTNPININSASRQDIKRALRKPLAGRKPSDMFLTAIMKQRDNLPAGAKAFDDTTDMRTKLSLFRSAANRSIPNLDAQIDNVEDRTQKGFIIF